MLQKTQTKVGAWPPNYVSHLQWRAETLRLLQTDRDLLFGAQQTYNGDPAQWVDDWVDTIDPRNAAQGLLVRMPFRLFPRQFELIDFFNSCLEFETNGLVEKSRDMGATWAAISYAVWLFLFKPGSSVGFGSRKAQLVDRIGDMDSIFERYDTASRHCLRCFVRTITTLAI